MVKGETPPKKIVGFCLDLKLESISAMFATVCCWQGHN